MGILLLNRLSQGYSTGMAEVPARGSLWVRGYDDLIARPMSGRPRNIRLRANFHAGIVEPEARN